MKTTKVIKLRKGPLFDSIVALMIGLTVQIGLVQVSPLYAIETPVARAPSPLTGHAPGQLPTTAQRRSAKDHQVTAQGDAVGWLDSTVDANFNDRFVQELLDEIGPGVTNAFNFVRDQIGYEAYEGSLRGARGTLWSKAGNSLDKASLLIALLRGQGIAARYVRGTLSANDARVIIRSMFDPVPMASAVGYIPERFPIYDPETDPGLLRWSADHWWVELENGTSLDPCFADSAVGQARGTRVATFFEAPEELRHVVVVRLQAELHNPLSQYTHLTPLEVTFSTPEVYGRAITLGHFVGVYQAPAVVTGFKTYTYSPYLMVDDNDEDWSNNELIRGTDYQEFLAGLFPLANSTLTRLTLEFEVRDPGKTPDIRTRDILDRVGYAARKGLAQPGLVDTSKPAFTELDVTTFFITPGFMAPGMVPPFQETLAAIGPEMETLGDRVGALTNRPPESFTADDAASINRYATLNRTAVIAGGSVVAGAFLLDSDYYLRMMRKSHLTLAYYDSPRITLFQAWTDQSTADPAMRMGLDLRRNHVFTLPYPGQNAFNRFTFNMAKGRVDSILEYLTVEHFLAEDFPEVRRVASPVRVLEEAEATGVRVEVLRGEYDIPTRLEALDISAEAKARIADALRAGRQVNVPVQMIEVDGQPSIGWWEIDMRTGEIMAVGEDGGNQDLIEFGIILGLVGIANMHALHFFGKEIEHILTASDANLSKHKFHPSSTAVTPQDLINSTSSLLARTITTADGSGANNDSEVSKKKEFRLKDGPIISTTVDTRAHFQIPDAPLVICGIRSVVDFSGTKFEVFSLYAPGPSELIGTINAESALRVMTSEDPAFVVVQGANQLPSSFRTRIAYTGDPAPANMVNYRDYVGDSFIFQLTGAVSGNIWGTDIYTYDSPLAKAAVHAGVVTNGQTATVKVTMLPNQASYTGSTRNGVTSGSFGAYGPSYRFDPIVTATDQALIALSGTVPEGWNLLIARATNAIPAGVTNQVSVFLQPQEQTPLPSPGTTLPFTVQVARVDVPGTVITQQMNYVIPEIHGLLVEADPETLYTSPVGSLPLELAVLNTGNVTQDVQLTLTLPTNFTATSLSTSLLLAPGQSTTQTVTVTAQSAPVDCDYNGAFTATYGPTNGLMKQVELLLHVAAPGSLQALNAANDAKALGRRGMATLLETLGKDLSRLYGEPTNEVYRSRVVADLAGVIQQLDDPLLSPFAADLETSRQAIVAATAANLTAALEELGQVLTPFEERLASLADHDFEVVLQPNTAETLPETPAAFGVSLKNKGRRTTSYQLSLSALPPGITGGLDTTNITLSPGALSAPGVAGAGQTATVTLIQPAQELTAFDFTMQVSVEGDPAITRTSHGSFVARKELVKVLSVETDPAFLDPSPRTEVRTFTGGDAGEGLDLEGNFPYAVDFRFSGSLGTIGDAQFTGDDAPGVQVQAQNWNDNWQVQNYGDTANDNLLETVMRTIRYNVTPTIPLEISLANVVPGQRYRLQMLFTENTYAAREFDVLVEDQLVVDDLNIAGVQGGVGVTNRGVVVVHEFVATDDTLNISLDASHVDNPDPNQQTPLICGLTLETLPGVQVFARLLNAVNRDRDVSLQYVVKDPKGTKVFTSTPQPAQLSVLSSLDTIALGKFDTAGLALGAYTVEVAVSESDGTSIPGAVGTGTLLVGSPVSAAMSVLPEALPPGDGRVTVSLNVASLVDYGSQGLALIGLQETTGTAESLALRGDYAYVGGSEEVTVLNIANPRNPSFVGSFGSGRRATALSGEHLLVRNGSGLEVYGLGDPEQPNLLGSAASGVNNVLIPDFHAHDGFALMDTLVVGYDVNGGAVTFVRGDLLAFDIRTPSSPQSLGLLFNTPHTEQPDWPGSDYFMGVQSAVKDNILFLPGSTEPGAAANGAGRLVLVDLQTPGAVSTNGEFQIPDTRVLMAMAVQGDRALVVGDSGSLGNYGLSFNGDLTLTLLSVTNPAQPVILGHTVLSNVTERIYYHDALRVSAAEHDLCFVSGVESAGHPGLLVVDASEPTNIQTRVLTMPAVVTGTEVRSNLLYATSVNGLAVYDLGGLLGVPVVASVRVHNDGSAVLVTNSFNVPPDQIIPGPHFDTLVWNTTLSSALTNQAFAWQMDVAGLQPGEAREVTVGGTVDFTAWGTESSIALPPLSVSGEQILVLKPSSQTARPGEPANFSLVVKNPTASPVTYDLALQGLPGNWVSLSSSVMVSADSEVQQTLQLRSEAFAAVGDYGFTVTAQADGGAMWGTVHGVLTLAGLPLVTNETHGVVVTLDPAEATAGQGTPAFIKVRVTNTGNVTEQYGLSVQLPAGVACGGPLSLEVTPGLDNYREVELTVTPSEGVTVGERVFTVTASSLGDASVQHQATGTVSVVDLGVALILSPTNAPPRSVLALTVANTGQQRQTFDLSLGGPAAPAATLPGYTLTLAAGDHRTIPLSLADLDYSHPGELSLIVLATARDNTNVQARASAVVSVPSSYGVTAGFAPQSVRLPGPGQGFALLAVRNIGNEEDAFSVRITSVTGPLTAQFQGMEGQLKQEIDSFRLPGLASGAMLLAGNMTQAGTGTVHMVVNSLANSNVTAQATVTFLSGVRLEIAPEQIIELTFAPISGEDHYIEYRESVQPEAEDWMELPGGPYNRECYYLSTPANAAAFAPDFTDTNRLFLDAGDRPSRFYRLRLAASAAPPLRMRFLNVRVLKFDPVPGFNHFVQYADALGVDASWWNLPRGPHNYGLAFDPPTEQQRFYRVLIQPQ